MNCLNKNKYQINFNTSSVIEILHSGDHGDFVHVLCLCGGVALGYIDGFIQTVGEQS